MVTVIQIGVETVPPAYAPAARPSCWSTPSTTDTGLPVLGVWSGVPSRAHRTTWAQVKWDAARHHATQGWAALPPVVPTDPDVLGSEWFSVLAEDGRTREAPVHEQSGPLPLYAEFRDWAHRVGMPWLANNAQPLRRPDRTDPAGLGAVRQRPGRPLRLGPGSARGLPAARGPAQHTGPTGHPHRGGPQ
jgi:hypothetical protein